MNKSLLYYSDPYLKDFTAKVLTVDTGGADYYAVTLSQTAFYPEGGGQPYDTGTIGGAAVTAVFERGGSVIHIVDRELAPDTEYPCSINWLRRFDHMQRHTAEHIVSGVIHRLHGADNVGFGISDGYVTMDYNVFLSPEDIEKVELLSNEAVFANLPVKISFHDGAPDFDYRSKKPLKGEIRIVTIDGYDICACCGTQTKTTGELGIIKIIASQRYKGGSRLYMACGYKALADYSLKQKNAEAISAITSSKINETAEAVAALAEEKKRLKYELYKSRHRLMELIAQNAPSSENVAVFEPDFTPEEQKTLALLLAKRETVRTAAVFSGTEGGYRYAIVSKDGTAEAARAFNRHFSARGGGASVAMGSVNAERQALEAYFKP